MSGGEARPVRTEEQLRAIWLEPDGWSLGILDQTQLPHRTSTVVLRTLEDAAHAIRAMQVRGAPLIGITAAYGVALAMRADASDGALARASDLLGGTRPTAVNLRWALEAVACVVRGVAPAERAAAAYRRAAELCAEDVATNRAIGEHGLALMRRVQRGRPVQVLTHCNAGWLATAGWGTALAPVYLAHSAGLDVHVWVDETRPRNQGALTAWELARAGVPHTLIVDNAGGLLMQRGEVELCIVGADRVARNGDVANKIGTYLKALAARDSGVPFYVAAPSSSIDWLLADGAAIPIEERSADEVREVQGLRGDGRVERVRVASEGTAVANAGFDITPARLITGLITERGVCDASEVGLGALFPERVAASP